MAIVPLGSRLLVKAVDKKELVTASGIVISAEWDQAPESIQGEVVAVGPEAEGFNTGDIVLIAQFAPTKAVEKPSDKTFIVPAEDVLGIVVPDKSAK